MNSCTSGIQRNTIIWTQNLTLLSSRCPRKHSVMVGPRSGLRIRSTNPAAYVSPPAVSYIPIASVATSIPASSADQDQKNSRSQYSPALLDSDPDSFAALALPLVSYPDIAGKGVPPLRPLQREMIYHLHSERLRRQLALIDSPTQ
jgi:hypothetical protein